MEDEYRELPNGWIRQFDAETGHQFFVDTKTERSIWHHPYDDADFMKSVSEKERERITALHRLPSHADVAAEPSDDDDDDAKWLEGKSKQKEDLTQPAQKKEGISRRMKNALTGTTHEEREAERAKRAKEEQHAYEVHQAIRRGMQKAMETGQPVKIMRNAQGEDIYIEPPEALARQAAGRDANGRSIDPYKNGPYANPNARFFRPAQPYSRGYGNYGYPGAGYYGPGGYGAGYGGYGLGYGGGLGMPLMGGLAMGGLVGGGLMAGGLGGFGGGGCFI